MEENVVREQLTMELDRNVPVLDGKDIWIWGAGHTAKLYQEGLKRIGGFSVCGYCDNDPLKWGSELSGKPVLSPKQLYQIQNSKMVVLLCTPQETVVSTVGRQLEQEGIVWYRLDETVFKLYKKEIMKCYDLLDDDLSKGVYAHIIDCHMKNYMPKERYISGERYFAIRPFKGYGKEVFVDCGAYTGDTIEQYIWKKNNAFKKIIAFEPDAGNYKAMECRIERIKKEWNLTEDKLELYNCAVGLKNENIAFEARGNMGSVSGSFVSEIGGKGNLADVNVVSLDDFLDEPYTFLKADIEGFEYNMIKGAQKGIKEYQPLIAVCIYHNVADLFQIQLLLHDIVPDYKFAVRHHSVTFDETVLYAYI